MNVLIGGFCAFLSFICALMVWLCILVLISSIGDKRDKTPKERLIIIGIMLACAVVSIATAKNTDDGLYFVLMFPLELLKTIIFS